jgi:hypothetical protein
VNIRSKTTRQESVRAIIDGPSETERLILVWCHAPGQGSRLELRQQSWGEGIGWFTQQSIPLAPEQVAELRYALNGSASPSACRCPSGNSAHSPNSSAERPLLVVRAEPA